MKKLSPPLARALRVAPFVAIAALAIAVAMPSARATTPACANAEIRIYKHEMTLDLVCGGEVARSFPVALGPHPDGAKEREGDGKTPEGRYAVSAKSKPARFDRFLAVSYPNAGDRARGQREGIAKLGNGIGIHGTKRSLATLAALFIRVGNATGLSRLWGPTDGCIGMVNQDVEVLYDAVSVGTPIVIAARRPR